MINSQIQEILMYLNRRNVKKNTLRHIITKLSKSNNKDENLKRTIGEKDIYRTIKKNDNRFSSKILLTKTQGKKTYGVCTSIHS